jgi:hypothetical protein
MERRSCAEPARWLGAQAVERPSQVECQFLEIHNEEVRDLLSPAPPPRAILIRESEDGQVCVCVCVCLRVRVCVCVCARARACVRVSVRVGVGGWVGAPGSSHASALTAPCLQRRSSHVGTGGVRWATHETCRCCTGQTALCPLLRAFRP